MIRISKHQLFTSAMLLEIGSTTLFALGIKAKQDAWLIVIVALLPGFFLLWVYTELQKGSPEKNLVEIIIKLLGKFLGIPLIILYSQYYIYLSVQVFTEFSELILITVLPETPRIVVLTIFMIPVIYVSFLGVEVLARTSEILFPITVTFIIFTYIIVSINGLVNLKQLEPVLGNGITSDSVFEVFHVMTFPYGDMVTLLMFWCYVDSKHVIRKTSFLALVLSGLLLSTSLVFIISTLGVKMASISTIPLLETIRLINIGSILTNLDILGIMIFFIGGFFKGTIYFNASVLALSTLLKNIDRKLIIVFLGIFVIIYGNILIKSFPFHRWLGVEIITKYMHAPFQLIIPCLLLVIHWSKKFLSIK